MVWIFGLDEGVKTGSGVGGSNSGDRDFVSRVVMARDLDQQSINCLLALGTSNDWSKSLDSSKNVLKFDIIFLLQLAKLARSTLDQLPVHKLCQVPT